MSLNWKTFLKFSWITAGLILAALTLTFSLQSLADNLDDNQKIHLAKQVMLAQKCGFCHTLKVQGFDWAATIGPDLTHQAKRDRSSHWLRLHLKNPEVIPDAEVEEKFRGKVGLMPSFSHLSEQELNSVIYFLTTLD